MPSQIRRNIPSFSTVTSSLKSYISSLPLLTTAIAVLCIFIYVVDAISVFGENVLYMKLGLNPDFFFEWGVYRLITFPYPHMLLGHILFNLIAFVPLSTAIEHTIGTLEYLYVLITIFTLLSGSLYLLGSLIFSYHDILGGLNTWILGVVVWESRELAGRERDIFGLFRVPAHFYPFVLLLVMQILFSFRWLAGHVCGLIVGYLFSFGYLSHILPSSEFFTNLESQSVFVSLSRIRGFIKAEEGSRGGWWLPIWNDDILEDAIHPPSDTSRESGTLASIPTAPPPPPKSTSSVVVPSSSSSSRSASPSAGSAAASNTNFSSSNENTKLPEEEKLLENVD